MTGEATEALARPAAPALSAYTPERPLLVLGDFPPERGGGGAVILRSLLRPEDRARLVWACLDPRDEPAAAREWPEGRVEVLRRGSLGRKGRRSQLEDSLRHPDALADEVADLARRCHAAAVWVILHGSMVHVAERLSRRDAWPLHLTVHDDPAYGCALRSRRYLALVPWIARDVARLLPRAASIDVISEPMARRYRQRYGVDSVVVHRGVPGPVEPSPPYDPQAHGLRVGILGGTYVYQQLTVLGRAVAEAAGRLGVPGRIRMIGRGYGDRLREALAGQVEVEVTGHLDEAEGVRLLRDCAVLYLNYPFGRRDAVLRQTSFPTKLSSYVMAARPLLVHAPADSSTVPLTRDGDGYATHWGTLRPGDGATLLERFWTSPVRDVSAHQAAEQVRRQYYDPDTNRRALFGALDALVSTPF